MLREWLIHIMLMWTHNSCTAISLPSQSCIESVQGYRLKNGPNNCFFIAKTKSFDLSPEVPCTCIPVKVHGIHDTYDVLPRPTCRIMSMTYQIIQLIYHAQGITSNLRVPKFNMAVLST
jgi:hypothetical protein